MRSMTGRLLSEDSEPTRSYHAEYPPFFSLPVKNLRKGVRVRGQTDLAAPPPHRQGEDLSGRARQDCTCRPGTEKAQRHPGWEGVVCPLSWNDHGCE